MKLAKLIKPIDIEERRGAIQKLIKLFSEILLKLFRWLQPRRQ